VNTCPPEPLGCRQWCAWLDEEGPYGYGDTEQEAIDNLYEQIEDLE
jgi:hypothetical protein